MNELIEKLQEFQTKGVEIKACTIVLQEKDNKWKNYIITTDTWGELCLEEIN